MTDIKITPLMLFLLLLLILIVASLFGKGLTEGFGNLTEGFTTPSDPWKSMTDYNTYFSNTIKLSNAADSDFYYDKKNGNIYRPVLIDDPASTSTPKTKKVSQVVMDIRSGNNKSTFDVGTAGQSDSIKILVTKTAIDDVTTNWKIMSNTTAKQQLNYMTWNRKTFIIIFNLKNSSETIDNSIMPTPNPKNEYNIDSIYYFDGETQMYKKDSTDNNGFKSFDLTPKSKYASYSADKDDDGSIYEYMYDFKNKEYQFMKTVKFDMRNGNLLITEETPAYKALKTLLDSAKTIKDAAVTTATSARTKLTAQAAQTTTAVDPGVTPAITTAVTEVTNKTTDALILIPATPTQAQLKTFYDNILAANTAILAALTAIGSLTTVSAAATTIKDAAEKVSTNAAALMTKIQTAYDSATTDTTTSNTLLTVYHRSNDSEIDPTSSNKQTYTTKLNSSTPEENKSTPSAKRTDIVKTDKPLFMPDSIGNRTMLYFPCDKATILVSFANCFEGGDVGIRIEKIQRFLTTGPVNEQTNATTPSPTTSTSGSSESGNHILDEYLKWSNYMLKTQVVPPVCPACPSCKHGSGDVCTSCGGNGGSGTASGDGKSLAFKDNSVADVKGPSSAVASVGKSAGSVLEKTVGTTGKVIGGATNLAAGTVGMAGGLIGGTVGAAADLVGGTIGTAANLLGSAGSGLTNLLQNDSSRVGYTQSYQGGQQNGYNRNNTGITPQQLQQSNNSYSMGTQAGAPIDTYSYNGALQSKGSNFRPLTADFSAFSK
jgi:Pyruvate/2-oxoacid:ferredoxin oxidoreductase gamma subunit